MIGAEAGIDLMRETGKKLREAPSMKVSEVYGPVCQGEGLLIGRPTIFVRFGGCDYRCSWCDSLYAVLPEHRHEWKPMSAHEIVGQVINLLPPGYKNGHVTLSGGNPAIQPAGPLIELLKPYRIRIAIETQGSVFPEWLGKVDDICVSPKPPSSGNPTPFDAASVLAKFIDVKSKQPPRKTYCHKVVVFDDNDYEYAKDVHRYWPNVPFFLQAGTQVGEASRDDLCDALTALQERVLADWEMQDVAVLPQLHAILKGHARGI